MTFNNDLADAEEAGITDSTEDRQPSMAVLVLGGFSAATAPPQDSCNNGPLQSTLSNMQGIAELELGEYRHSEAGKLCSLRGCKIIAARDMTCMQHTVLGIIAASTACQIAHRSCSATSVRTQASGHHASACACMCCR